MFTNSFHKIIPHLSFNQSLGNLSTVLLDLLFPPVCVGCHHNGQWLCDHCLNQIITPVVSDEQHSFFLSFGGLNEILKRFIHALKYQNQTVLIDYLPDILSLGIQHNPHIHTLLQSTDVLIPVPLSTKKLLHRGFNQSELICQFLQRLYPHVEINTKLKRILDTPPQAEQDRKHRLHNQFLAFRYEGEVLSGKQLLLVDDVFTTGTTLQECIRELQKHSPIRIFSLALGHGD